MKTRFTLYFLISLSITFAQQNQNIWKSDLDLGNGTIISTFLEVKKTDNQFTITTPKKADLRMLGGFKARLARLIGKSPRKGIIITINGKQKNDSLFGDTKIPMFGKLKFKGVLTEQSLSGEFLQDNTLIGTLYGIESKENRIDYAYLYPKILEITHDNIYSRSVLQTKEWRKFKKELKDLCYTVKDDIELFFGFNMLSSKLPFSHYNLFISTSDLHANTSEGEDETKELKEKEPSVFFEEKMNKTAYLKIKNFSSSQKELAVTLPIIIEKNYQNLIVDLRNNGGGGIDAAFEFAKYITDKDVEVGYFVTNKLKYSTFQPELFKTLPELQPKSTMEFGNELRTGKGAKLIFRKPDNPFFKGNLYVLTNGKTGSTCEPLVYALKNSMGAIIIGETTAGAMLAASPFAISGKYILMPPIADFYTYDGVRLEGIGVSPNIETTSGEALDKALELITE